MALRDEAALGTETMSVGAHTGKRFSILEMNGDTVLSALVSTKIDLGNNSSTTYETTTIDELTAQSLAGVTLKDGRQIAVPKGSHFSSLTIVSGSVTGVID